MTPLIQTRRAPKGSSRILEVVPQPLKGSPGPGLWLACLMSLGYLLTQALAALPRS